MANIRFLDNLSGNGRRETLGHLRQTGMLSCHATSMIVISLILSFFVVVAPLSSFLDIVRASCVALPEAEIYRFVSWIELFHIWSESMLFIIIL